MPFIPVPGVIQTEVRATYLNVPVENVLHWWAGEASVPPSDPGNVALSLGTAWVGNPLAHVSDQYVLREIFAFDMTVQAGVMATDTTVADENGTLSDAAMPGSLAAVVSLRTGLRGRSYRGRKYICGLVETEVTGNLIGSTRLASFVADFEAIMDDVLTATGYQLCIVSTRQNGVDLTTGVRTPVQSVLVTSPNVRSQRGRLT